ncbi:uncharacterized protein LY89DRAFT_228276 [Mollisia scopiformis]|uniref:Uncharacterized protein n=1 Tax=Mollisia scopiformis TaxID=149040 RepID=A0A194WUG6_MOLSC|nr:uncharacterized protein LY89DRAFT_228276 [Mollisia scopiformis]KUJ11606.1 hypothetical protein LY89DRAFT_228276 [Mollisia scopiformis]
MAEISHLLLAVLCTFLSLMVSADYHGVTFLFPIDGLTLSHDDTVNVTYTSDFPVPLLYTFCRNSTDNNLITEVRESVPGFNGSELVQLKWPNISSCYWDLRPNTSYGYGANSPSINVLATSRPEPSTVGLAQVTATGAAETGSASSDGTPSSTPSSSSSSGLSTGAKAGIGVGVALGVIIIAAVAGFFFLRRRKQKTAVAVPNTPVSPDYPAYPKNTRWRPQVTPQYREATFAHSPHQEYHEAHDVPKPQELPSDVKHEMPAGELRHELR